MHISIYILWPECMYICVCVSVCVPELLAKAKRRRRRATGTSSGRRVAVGRLQGQTGPIGAHCTLLLTVHASTRSERYLD